MARTTDSSVRRTLTIAEVAAAFGVGETLVRKMIRSGQLRSIRFGRRVLVPRDEVERVLSDAS